MIKQYHACIRLISTIDMFYLIQNLNILMLEQSSANQLHQTNHNQKPWLHLSLNISEISSKDTKILPQADLMKNSIPLKDMLNLWDLMKE